MELTAHELSELRQKQMEEDYIRDKTIQPSDLQLRFDAHKTREALQEQRRRHTVKVRQHSLP